MTVHDRHSKPNTSNPTDNVTDSAATTTLSSTNSTPKHSFDRQNDDVELYPLRSRESRERHGMRSRDQAHLADDDAYNSDDEHLYAGEGERLLGKDDHTLHDPQVSNIANVDALPQPPPPPSAPEQEEEPVSWRALPHKSQLAFLTLARFSEPLTQTSLQAYMFYQLKTFPTASGEPPSDSTVATQAGALAAAFTGAQFLTALLWGRCADSEYMGRKRVILVGLLGTAVGSLGFGFSKSFPAAVFWRAAGGSLNGNMGVMRTMVSEIVRDKKWLSRAFLLLPMAFNVGVVIGPILGGWLADPAGSHPELFGEGKVFGWEWLRTWPYALPNVAMACFLTTSAAGVFFGLEETLEPLRGRNDWGLRAGRWMVRMLFWRKKQQSYVALAGDEPAAENDDIEMRPSNKAERPKPIRKKLPFRRIWTTNVCCTLLAHGLLAMHIGTFNSLWFVFLSTPRYDPDGQESSNSTLSLPPNYRPNPPLTFTGGLALPPPSIGTALAILGVLGLSLQFLLYPSLSAKLGTLRSFRFSLPLFTITYILAPFLSLVPSSNPPPGPVTGAWIWIGIAVVLFIQVMARTFALPATAILVNNSSPHPSVLGTVHGLAQSVSSGARTVGPVLAGWGYGVGLRNGVVGAAWWGLAALAAVGAVSAWWVREGDGREIWLEGEEREEKPP